MKLLRRGHADIALPRVSASLFLFMVFASSCAPEAPPIPLQPAIHIHRTATCGCCQGWADDLQDAGFQVVIEQAYSLEPLTQGLKIPEPLRSCETAMIANYFIQGEVPPSDIRRLLEGGVSAAGLALRGSASLVARDDDGHARDTLLIDRSGKISVFAHHHGK